VIVTFFPLTQTLSRLFLGQKGFFIKCGQLCASNLGNGFPEVWQETMSVLQDKCPPKDASVIKQIISQELDFDAVFATFDPVPIGSASIGQVHRARLRRDGTPVVVKVWYVFSIAPCIKSSLSIH
jgi:predicted unusual protein kinase regulating ubiquinone biosynthesis (AarF/ABC1/UbiB family)